MIFNTGTVKSVYQIDMKVEDHLIENEPMLFQSDTAMGECQGGPLTRMILKAMELIMPEKFRHLRIDTRSTLLGEGDMASRGGWHCDFMSEDNYSTITGEGEGVEHYMLVSGPPLTQFMAGRNLDLKEVEAPFAWKDVSAQIDSYEWSRFRGSTFAVRPMTLYKFDAFELHRAVPSEDKGLVWRWFFRASCFPKGTEYANKIRKQVQIYRSAT